MYLIDTVVLSELSKRRPRRKVVDWFGDKPEEDLFLSVVTVGEIDRGVELARRSDPGFAEALTAWLESTITIYRDRILPVTVTIGRRWGRLAASIGHPGTDLLIAATAIEHGLTVVTRNIRHFAPTGVSIENPFAASD